MALVFIFVLLIFGGAVRVHATVTVVDYWRLGENDPGAVAGAVATNTTDSVGSKPLAIQGNARYANDVPAGNPGSLLSINFTNSAYATNSIISTAVNNFGIECWVKPTAMGGSGQVIAYNGATGGAGSGGWGLIISSSSTYQFLYGGITDFGTNPAVANVWTYLALVCSNGITTLYVNGAAATVQPVLPAAPSGNFALGAPPQSPTGQFFTGLMDEVRVFTFTPAQFNTNDLLWYHNLRPVLDPVAAANITTNSATLEASVNPNGLPTTAWFTFGTNMSYGVTNFAPYLGSGNSFVPVINNVSSLLEGTNYHFRAWASNTFGVVSGPDQTFVAANPPTVVTQPATAVTPSSATLNGTVQPNGGDTYAWFQYGLTTNYGISTPPVLFPRTIPNGLLTTSVSGLTAGVYHYEFAGSNASGISFGGDSVFVTAPPPTINSEGAANIGPTSATLTATVTPNGADTSVFFEFGTTSNYTGGDTIGPIIVPAASGQTPLNVPVYGLIQGLVYHFQVYATNAAGATYGGDETFQTPYFTADTSVIVPGTGAGAVAWGDLENDGLLDVVVVGSGGSSGATQVWHNNGDGTFSSLNAGITGVNQGSVALGDYDNDGLLDILICGQDSTGTPVTQLWHNTGEGFINVNAGLTGIYNGAAAFGDFDNNGRLDILLSGENAQGAPTTEVWRNTGNGFTNINAGLPPLDFSSVAVGDYDNDGRLDLLLAGYGTNGQCLTEVWRNTGNGFTNINAGLTGVESGSVAWGDFDNDGRLDILLSGIKTTEQATTEVWRNTGNGFTNINAGLPGFIYCSASWGDFDNDGRPDILLSGITSAQYDAEVWRNTGNGFVLAQDVPGGESGSAWGDFNNDGRLDFIVAGNTQNPYTLLMQSEAVASNTPPTAPTGLAANLSGSTLNLSWQPSTDAQTPTTGLGYNVRVGTSPGGADILDPMAGTNGTLRLPTRGRVQGQQLTLQLPSVPLGGSKIYWSVQSVDTAFAGSPFAPEASLLVLPYFTSATRRSDGTFEAQFYVQSGTNYSIEASTDLVHWVNLLNFSFGSGGPFMFTDPDATNYPERFYRFGQH
ncbi:MAG TPA: FG-GAP-like repeat-containing protein [Verrucomicrobiae bacterium]|nr:FG-GAP-like repeat-containing protein [Verrucomicrobiae bacterium]